MQWKYCEEGEKVYWKAAGLINGHRVELIIEDEHPDWEDGFKWTVRSEQYGTFFSPPLLDYALYQAREKAEQVFYRLQRVYEGKDDFE